MPDKLDQGSERAAPTILEAFDKWYDELAGWGGSRDLARQAFFAGNAAASGPSGATAESPVHLQDLAGLLKGETIARKLRDLMESIEDYRQTLAANEAYCIALTDRAEKAEAALRKLEKKFLPNGA